MARRLLVEHGELKQNGVEGRAERVDDAQSEIIGEREHAAPLSSRGVIR